MDLVKELDRGCWQIGGSTFYDGPLRKKRLVPGNRKSITMPQSYTYEYPRPMVTVDLVVFALADDGLRALFVRRARPPFAGQWAIPGGYLDLDEEIEAAARRELTEETGLIRIPRVEVIGVFGRPGRDPRGRTISIAHGAVIRGKPPKVRGGDDAGDALWLDPGVVEDLAFDHAEILDRGRQWLARGVIDGKLALEMMPKEFTEDDLRKIVRWTTGSVHKVRTIIRRWLKENQAEPVADSPMTFRAVRPKSRR